MEQENIKTEEIKQIAKQSMRVDSLATFQVIPEVDENLSYEGKQKKEIPQLDDDEHEMDIFTNSQGTPHILPEVKSGKKSPPLQK